MRKIIDGHLYNTETASCIASSGDSISHCGASIEALYRTRSGAWYVYSRSRMVAHLTPQEVCAWASSHNLTDDEATTIAALLGLKDA